VLRIQLHRLPRRVGRGLWNPERRDADHLAGGVHDRLHETRRLARRLRKQPTRSGISAKVEIEGAILLEEHEDVLDLLPHKLQLFAVAQSRMASEIQRVSSNLRA